VDGELRIKSVGPSRVGGPVDPARIAVRDRARAAIRHVGKAASRWGVTQFAHRCSATPQSA